MRKRRIKMIDWMAILMALAVSAPIIFVIIVIFHYKSDTKKTEDHIRERARVKVNDNICR